MKVFLALAFAAVIAGCAPSETETGAGSSKPAPTTTGDATAGGTPDKPIDMSQPYTIPEPDRKPKDGEEVAVVDTAMGQFVLMFFRDKAPKHVENFITLAKKGFYDGTRFHRVIPGFMIQGGDPNTKSDDRSMWGAGGPGYDVKGEMNDIPHRRGILSMARGGDPNSAGSQFFVVQGDSFFLNPKRDEKGQLIPGQEGYTAFGQALSGMDVVDKIVAVPTNGELAKDPVAIKTVKIVKWPIK